MENLDLPGKKKKNSSETTLRLLRSAANRRRSFGQVADLDHANSRSGQEKQSSRSPRRVHRMETPRRRRSSDGGAQGDIAAEVLGDESGADIDIDPEGAGAEEEVLAADAHVVDAAKLEEAATEAARRVGQHRQSIIEDVPRFRIKLGVTKKSFHRLMMKRLQRMLVICSMILGGHPVTPPIVDGRDTFHIVEVLRENGKDSVEILFRESDLYFLGFRPRSADHNSDPKFYLFNNVVTPEWPVWLPYRILPYDSGYSSVVADITVGRHCFRSIFSKLFYFNPENYKSKSTERGKALQWTMIMLSEALRIRDVQQLVERTLESGAVEKIGGSLDEKIHSWARHSRDTFDDVSSNNINWELKGCDGDLLTLKFSEEEALPVIIGQQKKVAAAVMLTEINSLIRIHFTANSQQLPNFHSCLILLLANEKGISVEVRQVVGLMLKNNLQLAFSSMPPSTQKFIKSELSTCIGSPNKEIRSIACTVVSVLLQIVGFEGWIKLFDTLVQCLDNHNLNQKEGAAEAMCKICKGFPEDFPVDADLSVLRNDIKQRVMQLFNYPYAILRKLADVKNPAVLSHVCKVFAGLKDIESEGLPSKACHVLNDLKQLGVMIAGADAFPP